MNTLKYLVVTILIMFFVFDGAFAEEKQAPQSKDTQDALYGFQDIPFGTPYEEVKQKLEKTYNKMEHTYSSRDWDDHISFNHFDLGDDRIEIQASFRFDHNKKFYTFDFSTEMKTADRFITDVYKEGEYLTEVFKNKYGKPSKCYTPSISTVGSRQIAPLCEWEHKDLRIVIYYVSIKAKYWATAYVTSKKMENEYNSYKKQQKNEGAKDGAKKF